MISVTQALKIVDNATRVAGSCKTISIQEAIGYVTCENIIAPISMPPFRQSAMDGYAVNRHKKNNYSLIGEIKAGDANNLRLNKGEAVRIFTGAPVPDSANAVVMQEKVSVSNAMLTIMTPINDQMNIRPLGEQVLNGQVALNKGTKITAAGIGYLASLGISEISVYEKPKIAIVVTGNELVSSGEDLNFGQIYESNAQMLAANLKSCGFDQITVHHVLDNYKSTVNSLNTILKSNDVLLVSGGISVGDYDFVGKALDEIGVTTLFYKVRQKPGKPLFFGKKEDKYVFALPGNPAAALSCCYIYVIPALQKISGMKDFNLHKIQAISQSSIKTPGDRSQFLKAIYKNNQVDILEGQNSSMLQTFALANALVQVPEEINEIHINDKVEVLLLPVNI